MLFRLRFGCDWCHEEVAEETGADIGETTDRAVIAAAAARRAWACAAWAAETDRAEAEAARPPSIISRARSATAAAVSARACGVVRVRYVRFSSSGLAAEQLRACLPVPHLVSRSRRRVEFPPRRRRGLLDSGGLRLCRGDSLAGLGLCNLQGLDGAMRHLRL